MPRRTAVLVLGAGLVAVALLTLGPLPLGGLSGFHRLLRLGATTIGAPVPSRAMAEAAANVLLFVPFGMALTLRSRRVPLWRVVVVAASLSVGIELTQGLAGNGRSADITDVLMNTLGGAGGWAVGRGVLIILAAVARRIGRSREA